MFVCLLHILKGSSLQYVSKKLAILMAVVCQLSAVLIVARYPI